MEQLGGVGPQFHNQFAYLADLGALGDLAGERMMFALYSQLCQAKALQHGTIGWIEDQYAVVARGQGADAHETAILLGQQRQNRRLAIARWRVPRYHYC